MTVTSPTVWLAQEEQRLRQHNPRAWSLLQTALRLRVVALVLVSAIGGGIALQRTLGISDTKLFIHASHQLFSANGINVFSDSSLQVGPLYLVVLGLLGMLAAVLHLPAPFVAGFVQAGLVAWLCIYLARSFAGAGDQHRTLRDIGVGTSLIFGPIAGVGVAGHFEEPLLATFMLLAAYRLAKGHATSAVLLLVLASGFKLWGVLGVPILLINGSPVAWLRRGAVYAAGVAACYLPFFAFGTVHTFDWTWRVWESASLSYLLPTEPFSWQLRVVQGALVCAFAGALALRRGVTPWAVPVMVIAVRLLFDPEQIPYYWVPLLVCLIVASWSRVENGWARLWPVSSFGALFIIVLPYFVSGPITRAVHTVTLVSIVVAMFLVDRGRFRPATSAGGAGGRG